MNKQVIVLSRNYSTALSVIRGLGVAGYDVDLIICVRNKDVEQAEIAACSKYVRQYAIITGKKSNRNTDTKILEQLEAYVGESKEKPMIFPTDDYSAMFMDRYRDTLENHFVMPYIVGGEPHAMTRLMDKAVQGRLARKVGMKAPMEWVLDLRDFEIPGDMIYPCFVKPLQSTSGYKTEMKRCDTKEELAEHLAYLKTRNERRSILVQEFLNIDTEISMSGVCMDQEILLPALVKKSRVAKHEKGVTLSGSLVPVNYVGEETAKLVYDVLREFHYVGQFDMELIDCGGEYYFGEVNLRSGGPNFAYTLNGINLPQIAARAVMGEERDLSLEHEVTYNKPFIYEKVAWEDYLNCCMTKKELDEALEECEDKLLTWEEDPEPGDKFAEIINGMKTKNRLKATLKKTPLYTVYHWRKVRRSQRHDYKKFMKVEKAGSEVTAEDVLAGKTLKTENRKRVILLSRNYCSLLGLTRALASANYDIEVIRLFQTRPRFTRVFSRINPEGYSKYVKNYHICVTHHNPQRLINLLLDLYNPDQETLLIPTDDLPTSILDDYYDDLRDYYLLPTAGEVAGRANYLMDKTIQKQMVKDFGFNTVEAHEIKMTEGFYEIPEGINYPCFLKPTISVTSSKKIMRKCESEADIREVLDDQAERHPDLSVMVEDYLNIEREYALLGLCAGDQVLIPNGIVEMLESGHEGRHGVTMIGQVIDTAPMKELIDQITAFMKTLNFTGLFDVDLLEADGKIYFCELNLRFGASGYAITASGVNLPRIFAEYMLDKKPINTNAKLKKLDLTFVSEKVLIEDYAEHFISKKKVNQTMKDVDIHMVYNKKDPEPYRYFKKFYSSVWTMPVYIFLRRVKRTIRKGIRTILGLNKEADVLAAEELEQNSEALTAQAPEQESETED